MTGYNARKIRLISFGKTYTTSGHKPAKVSTITAMPSPTSKKLVQLFIVMNNYLSKMFNRLSELAEPIRKLSKDKVLYNWGPEYQQAFTQINKEISSAPVLAYLQCQGTNCVADRCQHQRLWYLFTSRW